MSLPVIAIIVASVSAIFTGANMLISAATYRRGGPRLKLAVAARPYKLYDAMKSGDQTKWRAYLHVHVRNRSAASVEVESVKVVRLYPHILYSYLARRYPEFTGELEYLYRVKFLEGEGDKKIEPFGGVRWVLEDRMSTLVRPGIWSSFLLMLRVRVTLVNGQEIHSRPMSYRTLKRRNARIFQNMTRLAEKQNPTGQLSLDEALRELER